MPPFRSLPSFAFAALALTLLPACSTVGDVFQSSERDRIPGERKPVITREQVVLAADPSIAETRVTLPKPYVNTEWKEPGGTADNVLHHLEADGPLQRLWAVSVGEGSSRDARLTAPPIIAGGRIYVLDTEARVRALDVQSGGTIWDVDLAPEEEDYDAGFGGGIAFENGRIFVSTGYGFIVALDAGTGAEIWRHQAETPIRMAPVADGGRVFVATQDNQLLTLAADDGRVLWDHRGIAETAGILGSSSVAVSGDLVVVPYTSGELTGIRVPNGRQVWVDSLTRSTQTNAMADLTDIAGRPVIDRGFVFATSHSGLFVAIDTRTGGRAWARDVGGVQTPWVAGDYVYLVSIDAQVLCVQRADGRVKWVQRLPAFEDEEDKDGPIEWAGPVLVSDRLLLSSSRGEMLSLSPYTGEILGQVEIPDGVFIAPVVANGVVYVLTDNAELIALK